MPACMLLYGALINPELVSQIIDEALPRSIPGSAPPLWRVRDADGPVLGLEFWLSRTQTISRRYQHSSWSESFK